MNKKLFKFLMEGNGTKLLGPRRIPLEAVWAVDALVREREPLRDRADDPDWLEDRDCAEDCEDEDVPVEPVPTESDASDAPRFNGELRL
jgi:hypothetical protein